MTFQFDSNLITQAEAINAVAFTKYSTEDIHKALDCAVSVQGIADRIIADHDKTLRYSEIHNAFMIFAAEPHSFYKWHAVSTTVISALVDRSVQNLHHEIQLVEDAKRAGIIDIDPVRHADKVVRFQAAFNAEKRLDVISSLKGKVRDVAANPKPNPLTQALFDASR